ncbi:MAG: hypothetical protein ACRDUA_05430 [Micromonosporaceae bacterium]
MTAIQRPALPAATDALLRQIEHHLANLRFASRALPAQRDHSPDRQPPGEMPASTLVPGLPLSRLPDRQGAMIDIGLAERIAGALRRLVLDTTQSSAADRARVRAAVHYFVLNRDNSDDRRAHGLRDDARVVNQILSDLGRHDLVVEFGT